MVFLKCFPRIAALNEMQHFSSSPPRNRYHIGIVMLPLLYRYTYIYVSEPGTVPK